MNPLKLDATSAILFGVWATFALDVYGSLNSSPQTTELFAGDRADSLMHWVVAGDVVALAAGATWSVSTRNPWPLIATAVVVLGMHSAYAHAVKRGAGKRPPSSSSSSSSSQPAGGTLFAPTPNGA